MRTTADSNATADLLPQPVEAPGARTCAKASQMHIVLPFFVSWQATLQSLKAFAPAGFRGGSHHHDVCINAPRLIRARIEQVPDAAYLWLVLWWRLPERFHPGRQPQRSIPVRISSVLLLDGGFGYSQGTREGRRGHRDRNLWWDLWSALEGARAWSRHSLRGDDLLQFNIRLPSADDQMTRALMDLELQCLKANWPSC